MTATFRALAVGALVALALPASALAAPDRSYNLNAATPQAEWGGTGSGAVYTSDVQQEVACQPAVNDCDFTLIKLDSFGQLTLGLSSGDATLSDIDLHLYESDSSGTQGALLKESVSATAVEQIVTELEPGFYLVMIDYYLGAGSFDASAKWEALAPPADGATPPPAGTDPPAAQPNTPPSSAAKVKSRNRAKSLKVFKGTASDSDGSIAKVEIGLLWKKGSKCKQLTRSGSLKTTKKCGQPTTFLAAKGTSSWSFKLRKRLPKGRYTIFVRAIDDKGAMESGFGRSNRRTFTVS